MYVGIEVSTIFEFSRILYVAYQIKYFDEKKITNEQTRRVKKTCKFGIRFPFKKISGEQIKYCEEY